MMTTGTWQRQGAFSIKTTSPTAIQRLQLNLSCARGQVLDWSGKKIGYWHMRLVHGPMIFSLEQCNRIGKNPMTLHHKLPQT